MRIVLFGLVVVLALAGCNSVCDSAANVLEDKCGSAAVEEDTGESCEADSEILATCITDNKKRTCAEIQATCFGR